MFAWIVVGLAASVGLASTVVALLVRRADGEPAPTRPGWLLPSPRDVRDPRFRRRFQGYDPVEVEAHLDAVAIAYEALQEAAGPEAIARAEREVALRLGREVPGDATAEEAVPPEATGGAAAGESASDDVEPEDLS